jgi:hypothetical protein
LAFLGAAVMAALIAIGSLKNDTPEPRQTRLEDLKKIDVDQIVAQLQDPAVDRLNASVLEERSGVVTLDSASPAGSREPLVILRSDDDDGSVWLHDVLLGITAATVAVSVFLIWRLMRRRTDRR